MEGGLFGGGGSPLTLTWEGSNLSNNSTIKSPPPPLRLISKRNFNR